MPQEVLDLAQVSPLVCKRKSGRVPEHMSVDQRQPAVRANTFQHPLEPRNAHQHAAFVIEDELGAGRLCALELAQLSQLVAEYGVGRAS